MPEENALEILKSALLLERRGGLFYRKVAQISVTPAVKEFFELLSTEEFSHTLILNRQFSFWMENRRFSSDENTIKKHSTLASSILTQNVMDQIESAGFEAAAISAAISMEALSVSLYSHRSSTATDPEEKTLYQWLWQWEKTHLDFLYSLNRQLTEKIWFDNHFWPF
ncbi:MAG: ferritin family protein [Desulfobacterales bacterium]|nr:ferritin family protein [Desulfobacterales bacterium]MDD4072593.1 ferritin family protein [Desulfobacterales bacterium]MDD4391983.1 ferritin family protein [Desulfobacterales bacterium]